MKIFNKILILTVLVTISSFSFGQTFGIRAGLNIANIAGKDVDGENLKFTSLTGPLIAATVDFPLSKVVSIETGVQYSFKGTQNSNTDYYSGGTTNYKLKFSYIEIPLTGKFTANLDKINLYGLVGPYCGFGIGGTIYEDGIGTKVKWGSGNNADNSFNRFDYGILVGGGIEVKNIQLRLTYELGLANIISQHSTDGLSNAKNNVFGISIGYLFGNK